MTEGNAKLREIGEDKQTLLLINGTKGFIFNQLLK